MPPPSPLTRLLLLPRGTSASAPHPLVLAANALLVLGLLSGLFTVAFRSIDYRWNWSAPWRYRELLWTGWITTVGIAAASLLLSTVLGVAAALLAQSRLHAARIASRVYTELIRGTPLLVQILVLFYIVAPMFHLSNRLACGVLTLSLFSGAYIGEIVRAGIASVGESQWETARSLGLTRTQTYRWIVLPQTLRQILPPLTGQFVSLIKDSSLLSVIGIGEFALQAQQVNALTYSTLESYLPLALGYLALTLPLSLWARLLERRAHFDT